jgi:hypothetical protein
MGDLEARLRGITLAEADSNPREAIDLCREADRKITRLRAEIARLQDAEESESQRLGQMVEQMRAEAETLRALLGQWMGSGSLPPLSREALKMATDYALRGEEK